MGFIVRLSGKLGLLATLSALACGCSDEGGNGDQTPTGGSSPGTGGTGTGTGGQGQGGTCLSDGQILITDETNYTFSSNMTIESTEVKDATNLTFNWGDVTEDFFGVAVDPLADIDLVLVSLWGMTEQELADNLNRDNLPLDDNKGALTVYPDGTYTSAELEDFTMFQNEVPEDELWSRFDTSTADYKYPPESHTFMVTAATGVAPGEGSRMLGFFSLNPTSTNTEVTLTNASTDMLWSAGLANIPRLSVPAGNPALTIDWSQMTTNAIGNDYDGTQITEAVVAHYSALSLADLESQFLSLESLADGWWSKEVTAGLSINLATLEDATAGSFAGIDGTGVWLVALFCTVNCNNPAPWSITLLQPCQ